MLEYGSSEGSALKDLEIDETEMRDVSFAIFPWHFGEYETCAISLQSPSYRCLD
jgi:hypothetical protein